MEEIKGKRLFFYNFSNAGQALFDTLLMSLLPAFLLPPKEKIAEGMIQFLSTDVFWLVFTVQGIIMIFGRIIDAVMDPIIGSLSDRSRSKLGRRRKFLIIGGIPLALSTVLVFFPPVADTSMVNAIYLAIVLGSFFAFYTVYVAPYIALIHELGHTENKRINIVTVQAYFALAGGAVALVGGPFLISFFKGMGMNVVVAYQYMAVILGIVGAIILYFAVFAVDEKKYSNSQPSSVPLGKSLTKTLKNKPFIIFLITNMTFWFIFNTLRSSVLHITETFLGGDEGMAGLYNIIIFASSGVCFIFVGLMAKVVGKKIIYMIGLGSFAVISFLLSLTGIIPVNPQIWGIICFILIGIPVSIFLTLPNVFISEVCDLDHKATGEFRQGMFFGVHGFFVKVILGLSFATQSFLYLAFGKDVSNPLGVRLTIIVASVVAVIGFIAFIFYRIPKQNEQNA
ncbi:MAG: MFS transporter [Spirochaetales bacterium]|nr:MFS transporter [Spirochaetales bacterium]